MTTPLARVRAEGPRILKFGAVGIVATLVHTGVAFAALPVLGSALAANLVGFLTAFVVSFLGQAYWTFGLRSGWRAAALRFFIVSSASFLLSNVVLVGTQASGLLSKPMALLIAIAVIPVANFIAGRMWAFRPTV